MFVIVLIFSKRFIQRLNTEGDEISLMFTAPDANVLIVDDIKTNLKVVYGFLESYEMNVDMCLSGADAIEMVKSEQYDIVFMDYRMPDMDGIEATKKIREIEDDSQIYKNLPIIALTADAVESKRDMFIENGLDDFISKPIDADKLNVILEKWIPKHKQLAADA
ncbi:MAG: response regulator [Oscillospiraceae bacterium]|nr:response regulator [Oscillospiraceae bacterium]